MVIISGVPIFRIFTVCVIMHAFCMYYRCCCNQTYIINCGVVRFCCCSNVRYKMFLILISISYIFHLIKDLKQVQHQLRMQQLALQLLLTQAQHQRVVVQVQQQLRTQVQHRLQKGLLLHLFLLSQTLV